MMVRMMRNLIESTIASLLLMLLLLLLVHTWVGMCSVAHLLTHSTYTLSVVTTSAGGD